MIPLLLLAAAGSLLAQDPAVRLVPIADRVANVVDIQSARDGSGRLFLVQQEGVVRLVENGVLAERPFLDISSRTRRSGECGLLGLAFPPGFGEKRYFYVSYTIASCRESVVARYRLASRNEASPDTEEVLLRVTQPFSNHNGGQIQFGPDGFLYIGFGDGGSGGDPGNRAQNPNDVLGKMLRIDTESGRAPYAVPASNPHVNNRDFRPEIWASGLRNPWRFCFDRETGDLWIADVGQNRAEEIDFQRASSSGGENYGWRIMEGFQCFNPRDNCDRSGLTLPVHEYTRERGDVSVTGGYVYRGSRSPALHGAYIYADFATGRVWSIRREGERFVNRPLIETGFPIATFGEDEQGEVLVANYSGGVVYRIESPAPGVAPRISSDGIVDAASFQPGIVAGSLFTIFGTGFAAGASVTVGGTAVPVLALANSNGLEQINAQAPFGLTGDSASVTVSVGGISSPAATVRVFPARPALYTFESRPLVVHADFTLVTPESPARRGETVALYASGLGPVDNAPALGQPSPSNPLARLRAPLTATLDGVPCEVSYAGLAPGFPGVYQVNLRIPAPVTAGSRPLVIGVGGVSSAPSTVPVE
jgi:uncharacterized protein (TIGR03437 family)